MLIRNWFRKNRWVKYVTGTFLLTVVCTGVFFVAVTMRTLAEEDENAYGYVDLSDVNNLPVTENRVKVTSEGGNQKDSEGSGISPLPRESALPDSIPDIPPAVGKKGEKTNPFVILEIVPEHEQQQLIYLNPSSKDYPLDILKISIDAAKNKSARIGSQDMTNYDDIKNFGHWFYDYNYSIYKYGDSEEKTSTKFVKADKLFSLKLSDEDIGAAGYSVSEFKSVFNDNNVKISALIEKFPELKLKEKLSVSIANLLSKSEYKLNDVLEDKYNWEMESSSSAHVIETLRIASEDANLSMIELKEKYPDIFKNDVDGDAVLDTELADQDNWSYSKSNQRTSYTVTSDEYAIEEDISNMKMSDIINKYPSLFKKDDSGNEIVSSALENADDKWKKEKEDAKNHYDSGSTGYMVNVGAGKGDYYTGNVNGNQCVEFKDGGSEKNQWIYTTDKPSGDEYFDLKDRGDDFYTILNNGSYLTDESLIGGYLSVKNFQNGWNLHYNKYKFTFNNDITKYSYSYNKNVYKIGYYGLKATDIIKRSLFTFSSEEKYDEFNLKVVAMTPSELNQACKGDTEETLDWIERADMFYIASYKSNTEGIDNVYNMYNRYVLNKKDYTYNSSTQKIKTFDTNDLEWDLIYKILYRGTQNENLPILFNQNVGQPLENGLPGNEKIYSYLTEAVPCHVSSKGTYNNMAKLYLISIQMNLLAKKSKGYERTFADDILPTFRTVTFTDKAKDGHDKNSAMTTGYYPRTYAVFPPEDTGKKIEERESARYLWNTWTFYPANVPIKPDGLDTNKDDYDLYAANGYLLTYFNTNADPFRDGGSAIHQGGGDGEDGSNVGIVHKGVTDTNFSTIIGSASADCPGVVNRTMNTAYQILNRKAVTASALKFKVNQYRKMYVKISDDLVLVDYASDGSYDSQKDKYIYLKATITNENNEIGVLESVKIEKDKDNVLDSSLVTILSSDRRKELKFEDKVFDVHGEKIDVKGGSLTLFVKYPLEKWQKGYRTIRFNTKGRSYVQKNINGVIQKQPTEIIQKTYDVSVSERTLFELE